ncbi:MAG: YraN family protein [Desulfurivibrionaceae bacterium]
MTFKRQKLGKKGEDLARKHLEEAGYNVIESNYRTRSGEIDLIANDAGVLVFIEVKTRSSDRFGTPLEGVTAAKCRQISKVALEYLSRNNCQDRPARFDVVGVGIGPPVRVEVVKNAFTLSEGVVW